MSWKFYAASLAVAADEKVSWVEEYHVYFREIGVRGAPPPFDYSDRKVNQFLRGTFSALKSKF